jgi:pyruvate,water dikinase
VAALARAAERCAGRPQDVEWAIGDQLFLLQSRPITTLSELPDPDAPLTIWDNSNIVESYSGVTSPLTFSFAREVYPPVYRQFCRLMGVPPRVIAQHDDAFQNMLGFVRGRLFYNLLNWHRMLALLPAYRVNRQFMEQMMGVKEQLPDELTAQIKAAGSGRTADVTATVRTVAGLVLNHCTLQRQVRIFLREIDDTLQPPARPLEDCRCDELVAHYRLLRRRLLLRWNAPIANDFFAMVYYGVLRRLVGAWLNDSDGALQNDLIAAEGGMISAEPALLVRRLAEQTAKDAALPALFRTATIDEILVALETHPEIGDGYRTYLARFGERTFNELKLESATLRDDPLPLFRAVGALAFQLADLNGGPDDNFCGDGNRSRGAARARVAKALAWHPLRRAIFAWVLRQARRRVRDRENLRLERTRLFGRVRQIFVELGKRLHALDLLDDPRDVFYLEVEEIFAYVEGRSTCTDLRSLVAVRRSEFKTYGEQPAPPDRFASRGAMWHTHVSLRPAAGGAETGDIRRGIGCSPGTVCGYVRVVKDPATLDLRERSILIAEHTDPGWVIIFPTALGIVVERGSLLSHAAIVARELGIPAIVSAPAVTQWLQDGDYVEIDGSTGIVRRVRETTADGAARCA